MGLHIGGSLGRIIKKVANTKVGGVSLGSGLGTVLGPLGTVIGEKARGGDLKKNIFGDFKAGLSNTAKILPIANGLNGAGATGAGEGETMAAGGDEGPPVIIGHNSDGSPIFNPPSAGAVHSAVDRFRPVASASGAQGLLGKVGGFLSSHKDDILDYGAAAESIADKARRNKLQDQGLGLARADYARRQPLRDAGMAGLLDNSRPDLSATFADPGNPQGRYRRVQIGSR